MQTDEANTRQRKRKNYIQDWMLYRGYRPGDILKATGAGKELAWKWRTQDNFPTEEYLTSLLELLRTEREALFSPPPGGPGEGKGGPFHYVATPDLSEALPRASFTGRVGAGPSAINVEVNHNDAQRRIPVISGKPEHLRIAELDGDSLGVQFNGWMVVYGHPIPFKDHLPYGELCLVLTVDGEMTVKWLSKKQKRGITLLDAAGEPYREGVELQWAAPVLGMRPK